MFDQKLDQFITDDDVQVNNKNISKYTYWKMLSKLINIETGIENTFCQEFYYP